GSQTYLPSYVPHERYLFTRFSSLSKPSLNKDSAMDNISDAVRALRNKKRIIVIAGAGIATSVGGAFS
ncbi:hypothetical protein PMIN01_13422, partial [Paraphaeosphaeria minitans]